jgi:vacuolar protein sorting-associated protein 54
MSPTLGPTPLAIDVSEIVASACELANLRASKILAVRSEQHAGLQLTEFVEIFKENWEFVMATETLSNRMIVSLRGVTASQVSCSPSLSVSI